jgi:hypothetical protein
MQLLLQNNIANLDTALQNFPVTQQFFAQWGGLNTGMVILGDVEGAWDISTGYLRISVSAGARHNGLDATGEFIYIGGIKKQTRITEVSLYFHYDVFNFEDSDDQRNARIVASEIAADWLFDGVLNNIHNGLIPLTSTIYDPSGDTMQMCNCTNLSKGFFRRGMGEAGSRIYYGVLATHECIIQ